MENQLSQHGVYAESPEEVADDLTRSLGVCLLYFVEPVSVRLDVGDHLGDRRPYGLYLR